MAIRKLNTKTDTHKKPTSKKIDAKVLPPAKSGRITPAMARAAVKNVNKKQQSKK